MTRLILSIFVPFIFSFTTLYSQTYPPAERTPLEIQKFDYTFTDDFPWLEQMSSDKTKNWVSLQNNLIDEHLKVIRKKYSSKTKIEEYDFLSTNMMPYKRGQYYYSYYRLDKAKPAHLFFRENLRDDPKELINPSKIYKNNNANITGHYPSKNSKNLAAAISLDGSDRKEIRFFDIKSKKILDDIIKDVKFSSVEWNEDKGVFYKKNNNQSVFERDSTYQLLYHKLGTPQNEDKLLFDATVSNNFFDFYTTNKELLLIEYTGEKSLNFYLASLDSDEITLEKVIENETSVNKFYNYSNGYIYYSSFSYDWGEIKAFNIKDRNEDKVIVPQLYNHLLVEAKFLGEYIVVKYKTQGRFYITVYNKEGKFVRKFDLPYNTDLKFRYYDHKNKELYVTFYSYTISYLNYKLNLETGKYGIYLNEYIEPKPSLFTFDYFETKVTTYKSRDGKDIPITIVYKKGLDLNGNNPTLLKAYGGFGVISSPEYNTGLLYFLEKGGVFAYAEIRGGGDKGKKWHKEGQGLKKMNTFNDFIDAAEYLIAENYTNPKKLAITGGSQGGLLVGTAMTRRPELFKVAIPDVGIYDMFKFYDYTIGRFHYNEYGNPEIEEDFKAMMEYSPYHNIKDDVNYPVTLIITSENDDRVPPVHSYKFAAKLQNREAQKNPIYLRTNYNSGHHGKSSTYKDYTDQKADFYNFLMYHLNQD